MPANRTETSVVVGNQLISTATVVPPLSNAIVGANCTTAGCKCWNSYVNVMALSRSTCTMRTWTVLDAPMNGCCFAVWIHISVRSELEKWSSDGIASSPTRTIVSALLCISGQFRI
eukprot:3938942-Rhodomonas_salina.4